MSSLPRSAANAPNTERSDAAPPDELAPETFAERTYDGLEPLAVFDEANGWSLLILVNALGTMFQLVEELVRDTAEGPGWSMLMDVDRCPDIALPWLGQFAGVRLLPGSTPDEQRTRIKSTDGFKRGTPAALTAAAKATLTGSQTVVLRERYSAPQVPDPDGAYYLYVATYTVETPNPAATQQALLSQKPAGIVLVYTAITGQDYQTVKNTTATYAALKSKYASYGAVRADIQ